MNFKMLLASFTNNGDESTVKNCKIQIAIGENIMKTQDALIKRLKLEAKDLKEIAKDREEAINRLMVTDASNCH